MYKATDQISNLGYDQFLDRSIIQYPKVVSPVQGSVIPSASIVYNQLVTSFDPEENLYSSNFATGSTGWCIFGAGNVEFNDGTFRGSLVAGEIHIPDEDTTASSFHVDSTGAGWVGATTTNRATAPMKWDAAGSLTVSNATVSGSLNTGAGSTINGTYLAGASVLSSKTSLAARGWTMDLVFSATATDQVDWTAGTITVSDGTAYSIDAGNTGVMAAKVYIYLNTDVSETVLQITTTAATAVGDNKLLIATAEDNTTEAIFQVFGGAGGVNIDAANIVAGSITANEIAASTITADRMTVSELSAITADMGNITAGTITLNAAGWMKGGQTDFNTGTGWFIGFSAGDYKLSLGDSDNYVTWDGSYLRIKGSLDVGDGGLVSLASYTVANLPIPPTEDINAPSANE